MAAQAPQLELGSDEYKSSDDSDFNPAAKNSASDISSASSTSDDDAGVSSTHKPKRKRKYKKSSKDVDLENSGDEGILTKAKKKRCSSVSSDGSVIRTRAQKKKE
jgi:hypothetical protein